jgi:hypothetical protein
MYILGLLWKKLVCNTLAITIEFGSTQKVIKARSAVRRDVSTFPISLETEPYEGTGE